MLRLRDDQATYLLATCDNPAEADTIVRRLREFPKISVYESEEFSNQSKVHWFRKTKVGIALGFAAALGLAVGASITSHTLYAATVAAIKELAVLRALGISRWRMRLFVMQQSLLVGVAGLLVGAPITFGLAELARSLGTQAVLPPWLLLGTAGITLGMSLLSGLYALRSLKQIEPALLLR
ncbi:MAG: ABC transporter permease [Planctomycetota bacterium]